ncbi:hypothetical protein [Pilimelia terevasa]|uniref:hypothetical protein n=1 Tax=Pilimelia terevasa TaxID=53372 RepID=UPI00166A7E01|nr:hypothetical protein [Pilimelia terevasa]
MADPYRIDPATLAAACARARRQYAAGEVAEATALLSAATEAAGEDLGAGHDAVLAAAAVLARMYRETDDPAAARRVLELHLAEGGRVRGEDDPELLAMAAELGAVAAELGNRHEACRQFTRVAHLGGPVLGDTHPAVQAARAYLDGSEKHQLTALPLSVAPPLPATTIAPSPSPSPSPHGGPAVPARAAGTGPDLRSGGSAQAVPAPPARNVAATAPPVPAPPAVDGGRPAEVPGAAAPAWTGVAPAAGLRGRGGWVVAGVAVVLALCAAGIATVALLRSGAPPRQVEPTGAVRLTGEPPADVTVAREPGAVVVRWRDPSGGRATFLVTGGQAGAELRLLAQLPAGAPTRYTAAGFHPALDYCFQVSAVYSTTEFGVASPVCTRRE